MWSQYSSVDQTWRVTQSIVHKLQTSIKSCLHKILCIRWPEKISTEDLWRAADQESVAAQICRRKWGWIVHTPRKPASNVTRQALSWNPQGKWKRGRPRNTSCRDTEAEMHKSGHCWKELEKTAQRRVPWQSVVNGLYSSWGKRKYTQFFEQIRPWDTLACCWDLKATNQQTTNFNLSTQKFIF